MKSEEDKNNQEMEMDDIIDYIDKYETVNLSKQNSILKDSQDDQTKTKQLKKKSQSQVLKQFILKAESGKKLQKSNIEVDVKIFDDYIKINDNIIRKPFVEKPFDAENHNINIYYPLSGGGGTKNLFRKVGNQSSFYDITNNNIREDGNYLIEEFLQTNGFDIKVYTVGPDYAHAEARKSPVLDGIVNRSQTGKEIRYPINLTSEEKMIARKIVMWFGQNVCGFDLLRSKGKSYVCDVNGWSFVKGNDKYYQDCAILLKNIILKQLAPKFFEREQSISTPKFNPSKSILMSSIFRPDNDIQDQHDHQEELRSVVAVFRHGDRTPKQKMKMKVRDSRFLQFFDSQQQKDLAQKKEIKLKSAKQLQKMLDVCTEIFYELIKNDKKFTEEAKDNEIEISKILQLKSVLEQNGMFQGYYRKIQLKPLQHQMIINQNEEEYIKVTEALLILKWGGEITHSGLDQAKILGEIFRNEMYPSQNDGILRLHSTYRHDMKIYSSDEGRCLETAGAFCKGFLDLEGSVMPIIESMVNRDEKTQHLLNCASQDDEFNIIQKLDELMNQPGSLLENFQTKFGDMDLSPQMITIMLKIGDSQQLMIKLHGLLKKFTKTIRTQLNLESKNYYLNPKDIEEDTNGYICGNDSVIVLYKRWQKIEIDFYDKKNQRFQISKIPDIFDSIRYDQIHNYSFLSKFGDLSQELIEASEMLANFVTPLELGIDNQMKIQLGLTVILPLYNKIKQDLLWWNSSLNKQQQHKGECEDVEFFTSREQQNSNSQVKSPWRHIRTRFYFTSASHVYTLFNIIHLGLESKLVHTQKEKEYMDTIINLNYLSHLVFRVFEDLKAGQNDIDRFRIELCISPGCDFQINEQYELHYVPICPVVSINTSLNLTEIEQFFDIENLQNRNN